MDSYNLSTWALFVGVSMLLGTTIECITYLLLGHMALSTPGGSLYAGVAYGLWWNKHPKPTWTRIAIGALAGLIGWFLFFMSH